jgi:hypothetical protein
LTRLQSYSAASRSLVKSDRIKISAIELKIWQLKNI